jgi:hypothetical protein
MGNSHKGRKRLSSLFSSNSLSSHLSDKDRESSPGLPSRRGSTLNTSTSGASTPTGEVPPASNGKKYPGLGVDKSADGVTNGVDRMALGSTAVPLVSSPTSTRPPTSVMSPGRSTSTSTSDMGPDYGRWVDSDDDTSDEELSFRTPSEGLSEVEEDDEEEEAVIVNRPPVAAVPVIGSSPAQETEEGKAAGPNKPVRDSENVLGTGPSTIMRTKHERVTQVVRHLHSSKESALSIDQEKLLAPDLDTCREALTLFLTSQMQKAEHLCTEKDPDANHLYLLSAGGIIQALKVSHQEIFRLLGLMC